MLVLGIFSLMTAVALPNVKISPILLTRVASIVLLYAAALSFNALDIQAIGSGVSIYSGLFQVTSVSQSIDTFIFTIGALILLPWAPITNAVMSQARGVFTAVPTIAEYPLVILFAVCGSSFLVSSADLVSVYLSIELQSFAVYILATLYRDSESATSAGLKYFLLGGLSSGLILLGSALVYAYTGLTNLESIFSILSVGGVDNLTSGLGPCIMGLIILVVGFLFKVSAAPFHNWAPDVYDGVPTVVTTWLTTMPKIAFLVFILEFQGFTQLANWSSWTYLLLISSLLSLLVGTIGGLAQYRIKRLLTYSTISHVGFLLLALAINNEESVESFLFYLIQYSLTNINVFFILVAFGYLLGSKGLSIYSPIQLINQLKGQFKVNPLLGLSLAICLFSMAGIPPLVGFFGKQMVLYAATHNGNFFLAFVAILVSVVSAAYYLRVIKVIHFDPLNVTETVQTNKGELATSSSLVIATITLLLIFFIINPTPLLNSVHLITLNLFYW